MKMTIRNIILAAAGLVLIGSCGVQTGQLLGTEEEFFFDFGKYEAEGFRISPYEWEGNDFTWIGEYTLDVTPDILKKPVVSRESMGGGEFSHERVNMVPVQMPVDRDAMLDKFVKAARQRGADAAVNFVFEVSVTEVNLSLDDERPYYVPRATYRMKAYLIKR